MKDERGKKAIDVAILFGEGNSGLDELNSAADAADAKIKNQMATADACRKYLPIEIWNVEFD